MKKINLIFVVILFYNCLCSNVFCQWINLTSGINYNLNSVFFIDESTGWVVTQGGEVIKTTNGGINWINPQILSSNKLKDIYFINANTGWIAGRERIWRTTNAGNNWNEIAFAPGYLNSVFFINNNTGWTVGDYALFKSTNGGDNWIDQWNQFDMVSRDLNSVMFINNNTGWTAGCCDLLKTTNGGDNWVDVNPITGSPSLTSIYFINNNVGWTVGRSGKIFKSTNVGINWTEQISGTNQDLYSIYFQDNNTGWIAGGSYLENSSIILKTINSGNTWIEQTTMAGHVLLSIQFINISTGWAVGNNGTLLKTTNGGGSVGIQNISTEIPNEFSLSQNYPNPFNPTTNIEFSLPEKSFVKLKVFDITGKEIAELVNENLSAGTFRYEFNAENLPSGLYFYKLVTDKFSKTKRMILIK